MDTQERSDASETQATSGQDATLRNIIGIIVRTTRRTEEKRYGDADRKGLIGAEGCAGRGVLWPPVSAGNGELPHQRAQDASEDGGGDCHGQEGGGSGQHRPGAAEAGG